LASTHRRQKVHAGDGEMEREEKKKEMSFK
jgi:hypothetical protein